MLPFSSNLSVPYSSLQILVYMDLGKKNGFLQKLCLVSQSSRKSGKVSFRYVSRDQPLHFGTLGTTPGLPFFNQSCILDGQNQEMEGICTFQKPLSDTLPSHFAQSGMDGSLSISFSGRSNVENGKIDSFERTS